MTDFLVFALILIPALAAGACGLSRTSWVRTVLVIAAAIGIGATALVLAITTPTWPLALKSPVILGFSSDILVAGMDLILLVVIFRAAAAAAHWPTALLTAIQFVILVYIEGEFAATAVSAPALFIDFPAFSICLVTSLVGPLICLFALPYMKHHEAKHKPAKSRQPIFFFYMLLFVSAMNGLIFSNNILWLAFFWEVTTYCSFKLIGHDRTPEAAQNALTALWMNMLGGLLLLIGVAFAVAGSHSLSLQKLISYIPAHPMGLAAAALMILAAWTKSAQLPFHRWLLGAMVAPTPVSALLHSSTMVNAGVYLALRLAPGLAGTFVSWTLAALGGTTFLAGAVLALSTTDGKRILAYSTISNLGFIFVCAGVGTPLAITAGVLLLVFHAVSKGLLFLSVGATDQTIGSRDIEAMRGLYRRSPFLAGVMGIGILTMVLPPFGVLAGKWLALEVAADHLLFITLLSLGSAATMVFWIRWVGTILSTTGVSSDHLSSPVLFRLPLAILACAAVGLSLAVPWMAGASDIWELKSPSGGFAVLPLGMAAVAFAVMAVILVRKISKRSATVYASGVQNTQAEILEIKTAKDQWSPLTAANPTWAGVLSEPRFEPWLIGIGILGMGLILMGIFL